MAEHHNIPVRPETKERVTKLKRGNDSYDDAVKKLLEAYQEKQPA